MRKNIENLIKDDILSNMAPKYVFTKMGIGTIVLHSASSFEWNACVIKCFTAFGSKFVFCD